MKVIVSIVRLYTIKTTTIVAVSGRGFSDYANAGAGWLAAYCKYLLLERCDSSSPVFGLRASFRWRLPWFALPPHVFLHAALPARAGSPSWGSGTFAVGRALLVSVIGFSFTCCLFIVLFTMKSTIHKGTPFMVLVKSSCARNVRL